MGDRERRRGDKTPPPAWRWTGDVRFYLENGRTESYSWNFSRRNMTTGRVVAAGRLSMRDEKVPGRSAIRRIVVDLGKL